MRYRDREHAGLVLAELVAAEADLGNRPLVLGLVRGGVPVAAALAGALRLPLDALMVRKLGVPGAPEVAFGALGPAGVRVINDDIAVHLDEREMAAVEHREAAELVRREALYRADRPPPDLRGRTALIVDDGLATGATARAAVAVARLLGADRVLVAVPVGSPEAVDLVERDADGVLCPEVPWRFMAVGLSYADFSQVTDAEVLRLLANDHSHTG
ncbi:phosphoribosyltransferase family protein [Longispora sp. K20-0274]|uniref:phosphoribosyltransferase n=1 Tax=Longispora sp. K20-0274 TaxID=3088255 RepID=UPI00399BAEFC